ncbi:hypothetical protein [Solwaraspora sp. WMMD1047]|uniref:hypothetical protein n=1 Tax=Solwaraspora sp. WMMD1047 TaxID=3016102 RepID=UPI003242B539
MVHLRGGLDRRQALLEAHGDHRREGHPRRHAGHLRVLTPTSRELTMGTDTSRTTDIVPGPGGVMTDEVGVVTGELTLRTEYADGQVTLRVQYKDAEEWYAVTGGKATLPDPAALDAVHTLATALLNRPEG